MWIIFDYDHSTLWIWIWFPIFSLWRNRVKILMMLNLHVITPLFVMFVHQVFSHEATDLDCASLCDQVEFGYAGICCGIKFYLSINEKVKKPFLNFYRSWVLRLWQWLWRSSGLPGGWAVLWQHRWVMRY